MTYEIAKELKDAGFPQRFKTGSYYAEKDASFKEQQKAHFFFEERQRGTPEAELAVSKLVSIPTLSELIEACGERFDELSRMKHYNDPNKYSASAYTCEECEYEGTYIKRGGTPEEAVAKLWLALNKK